jgi:tetratricopeptide (TPR) repeat protein
MLTTKNVTGQIPVFFLALGIIFSGCMPKGPRALLEGKELIDHGRYAEAVEKLQTATALIGTNAVAWNYLGLAYHQTQQGAQAEQAYLKALALDRNLVEVHYNLGCLRLEQNQLEPAKTAFIAYTALRGNSTEGWVKLATTQLRLRELAGAEKSFGEALRLNPQNPEALNGVGLIQLQRKNAREAAQLFGEALKAQPGYAPALLNLAIVNHDYLNNRPAALEKYNEYLALPARPQNWDAVRSTAEALQRELNPPPRMPVASNPPLQTQPTPPLQPKPQIQTQPAAVATKPASNSITRAAVAAKPDAATGVAKPAVVAPVPPPMDFVKLSSEPVVRPPQDVASSSKPISGPKIESPRASASVPQVEPPKSEKRGFLQQINPLNLFRNSTSAPPKTVSAGSETVVKAAATKEPTPPVVRYKYRNPTKPVTGDRSAAELFFNKGAQAQREHRFPEAVQAYQQATRLDPAYFEAYYNLALSATTSGNLSQSLTAYETALALRPDSLEARYNFALVLKQATYVVDSANELEKLLVSFPSEARAHVVLGNLYAQQLRQPARAKEHYQKVLEIDPGNPQAPNIRYWLTSH